MVQPLEQLWAWELGLPSEAEHLREQWIAMRESTPIAESTLPRALPCHALLFVPLGGRILARTFATFAFAVLALALLGRRIKIILLTTTTRFYLLIGMEQLELLIQKIDHHVHSLRGRSDDFRPGSQQTKHGAQSVMTLLQILS